jgi:glycosyltransferase involved in cell wall biosynthesis
MNVNEMRVAIIHEWLVFKAGSESVVEQILQLFPGSDVYCMVDFLPDEDRGMLGTSRVYTSFIQHLPFAKKKFRAYLPLMPLAVEQFDLSAYDLIISSSHAVAKGVITGPNQLHISYVHSPIRYAWDLQPIYLKEAKLTQGIRSVLARLILHYMRLWDYRTSNGVDHFVANSNYIARRINKVYRRTSEVIYPPVHLEQFTLKEQKEDFYFTASRFVPYKKISLIVEAFTNMPDKRLVIIGDGSEFETIKANAGSNITFLGFRPRAELIDYMQRARAFVFAAEEDFGIVLVEAQGCGTPVIAYGKGGAVEIVLDGETGVLFPEQTVPSLTEGVRRFEALERQFNPKKIRIHAEQFDEAVFRNKFREMVGRIQRQNK